MPSQPAGLSSTEIWQRVTPKFFDPGRLHTAEAILFLLILQLLIAGCRGNAAPGPVLEQTPLNGSPMNGLMAESANLGLQQPPVGGEGLVFWVPPFFSINTADRADAVLAAALAELAPSITGAPVTLITKAERGPAGMFSYLSTTNQVASKLLPDIMLLNSFDLARAADANLVVPLSPEESAPFSNILQQVLQTAQTQDALFGLPFVASLEHLVYWEGRMPSPPDTWDAFLDQEYRLLFAGGSTNDYSVSFLWTLYLIGGGGIDKQGQITDPDILKAAFELLDRGREGDLIADSVVTLSSPQAVWTFFANGNAEMAVIPASLYTSQNIPSGSFGFSHLPTPSGEVRSVVTSWSFAVVTQNPGRRQKALLLLEKLFAPNVQGEWSRYARQLPTQLDAFAYWDANDPYTLFLQEMLVNSVAPPDLHTFDDIDRAMQQAQRDLLIGEQSPVQLMSNPPWLP